MSNLEIPYRITIGAVTTGGVIGYLTLVTYDLHLSTYVQSILSHYPKVTYHEDSVYFQNWEYTKCIELECTRFNDVEFQPS